jgi:hypothetical protein
MLKRHIGKFYKFNFTGRKDDIYGIVLDFNDQWTLIKRVVDYYFDGYTIFRNIGVKYEQGEYERFASKVLSKKYHQIKTIKVPLTSLEDILLFVDKGFKLIQLDMKDGKAFDVVRYVGVEDNNYVFDELTPRGKWRYKLKLTEKEIRYISFDNDYVNSLRLMANF